MAGTLPRRQLVGIAAAVEGALAVFGFLIVWWRTGRPAVPWAATLESVGAGLTTAACFALALHLVLRHAPAVWPATDLRKVYREVLRPVFGEVRPADVVFISVVAGIGEEILFRAALQPLLGLIPTSVVFGLLHVFGRDSIPLGLWALAAGLVFGWLATATGGLVAPIVAHVVYDAYAIARIRWGREE